MLRIATPMSGSGTLTSHLASTNVLSISSMSAAVGPEPSRSAGQPAIRARFMYNLRTIFDR